MFGSILLGIQPGGDGFADVGKGFVACLALGPAATEGGNMGDKSGIFPRFDNHFERHRVSFPGDDRNAQGPAPSETAGFMLFAYNSGVRSTAPVSALVTWDA